MVAPISAYKTVGAAAASEIVISPCSRNGACDSAQPHRIKPTWSIAAIRATLYFLVSKATKAAMA